MAPPDQLASVESGALGLPRPGRRLSRWHVVAVVALVLAGAALRFTALDRYPLPIQQDELSDIYDGYSLTQTGTDRAGDAWPAIIRGMGPGDYHPAWYAYLAAASTGLLGFSVWAGRLPAAISGLATILMVYVVARRMLGNRGAVPALALIVFSPVHLLYSRQAHTGGCTPPLFAILVVYLLLRSLSELEHPRRQRSALAWVAAAGFIIGLSANGYGALRLSAVLFATFGAGLLVIQVGWRQRHWPGAALVIALFASAACIGAAPQLHAMITEPENFFARASTVVYPLGYGPHWWVQKLAANLALNLDPRYLFLSFGEARDLAVARLSVASLPLLYPGFIAAAVWVWRERRLDFLLLLGAVAICLVPAVSSKPNPHAMRSSGVWALYPIIAASGALALGGVLQGAWRRIAGVTSNDIFRSAAGYHRPAVLATTALTAAIAAIGTFNVVRFLDRPDLHGVASQNHLVRLGKWLGEHGRHYDRVYVDTPGHFPYLYLAAFSGMSPAEFKQTPREGLVTMLGWEKFRRFGRMHFADSAEARKAWDSSNKDQRWLLVAVENQTIKSAELLPQRQVLSALP